MPFEHVWGQQCSKALVNTVQCTKSAYNGPIEDPPPSRELQLLVHLHQQHPSAWKCDQTLRSPENADFNIFNSHTKWAKSGNICVLLSIGSLNSHTKWAKSGNICTIDRWNFIFISHTKWAKSDNIFTIDQWKSLPPSAESCFLLNSFDHSFLLLTIFNMFENCFEHVWWPF